jgi:hypothetical protein
MLTDLLEEELQRRTHAVSVAMEQVREAERLRADAAKSLLANHDATIAALKERVEEAKHERNVVGAKLRIAKREAQVEESV